MKQLAMLLALLIPLSFSVVGCGSSGGGGGSASKLSKEEEAKKMAEMQQKTMQMKSNQAPKK